MFLLLKFNKKIMKKIFFISVSVAIIIGMAVYLYSYNNAANVCTMQDLAQTNFNMDNYTNTIEKNIKATNSQNAVQNNEKVIEPTDCPPIKKTAYLTFDDGPSEVTLDILEVLKEYNVKATFFVISADNNKEQFKYVKNIIDQGHKIGLHSATHSYKKIYDSTQSFWKDIEQLKSDLGVYLKDDMPKIIRFPGGSKNTVSKKYGGSNIMKTLIAQAEEKGYIYVDWNCCAEDATGSNPSPEKITQNIIKDSKDKDTVIVLMHDTKRNQKTAQALPSIIENLQQQGFVFETLETLHHSVGQ